MIASRSKVEAKTSQDVAPDKTKVEDFPLPVAEDYPVAAANEMAKVIDMHLEYESGVQGRELRPMTLCPDQQISLTSDLRGL